MNRHNYSWLLKNRYKLVAKTHRLAYGMDSLNRFRHEPNAIANSFNGMIDSKSLNETD